MEAHRDQDLAAMRITERVETGRIGLVRFLHADLDGLVRGVAISGRRIGDGLRDGVEYAGGLLTLLDTPVPGVGPVAVRLMPDPATYTPLPYAPGAAALLADLVRPDGEPWEACPRTFLKAAVADLTAAGCSLLAGFAPEFTLGRRTPADDGPGRPAPIHDGPGYAGFDAAHDYVTALVHDLETQGLRVEEYHPEAGPGRQALSTGPAEPLRAADDHVLYRETVRAVALRQGLWATLAPLPFPGGPGNDARLRLTLTSDLPEADRWFAGGLAAHLPALTALTRGSVNSFRRAGHAAVRVSPAPDPDRPTVIEYTPSDSSANPYLALGAVIHAGLDGIRHRTEPAEPPASPRTLAAALDALDADEPLRTALGRLRRAAYVAVKRAHVRDFTGMPADRECAVVRARF